MFDDLFFGGAKLLHFQLMEVPFQSPFRTDEHAVAPIISLDVTNMDAAQHLRFVLNQNFCETVRFKANGF